MISCMVRNVVKFCKKNPSVTWKSTLPTDIQIKYIQDKLEPSLSEFILTAQLARGGTTFDRVQKYCGQYSEKCLLVEPETGRRLAEKISQHSRRGPETVFYDAEGGFAFTAAEIEKRKLFRSVSVLEKDSKLRELHKFSKKHFLDSRSKVVFEKKEFNVAHIAAAGNNPAAVSPLLKLAPANCTWDSPAPPYTLLSTVTQSFLKYLTRQCLHKHKFSEFNNCRPEFFFLMTVRSYFHLCCGVPDIEPEPQPLSDAEIQEKCEAIPQMKLLLLPRNVLFRFLFDFYVVDMVPRDSFLPWKPHKPFNKIKRSTNNQGMDSTYLKHHDKFLLVYVRPKLEPLVDVSQPFLLQFYLRALLHQRKTRIIPILERWADGSGLHLLQSSSRHNVFSHVADLSVDELAALFNYLVARPDFSASSLAAEAETFEKYELEAEAGALNNQEARTTNPEAMQQQKLKLMQRLSGGKVGLDSLYSPT